MNKSIAVALSFSTLLFMSQTASAGEYIVVPDLKRPSWKSAVSGYASSSKYTLTGGVLNQTSQVERSFLKGIEMAEVNDKPCDIKTTYTGTVLPDTKKISPCRNNNRYDLNVVLSENSNKVVDELRVCTSKSRRIKGLEIDASNVSNYGVVSDSKVEKKAERPHCRLWHDPLRCPKDMLVSKLIVYYNTDGYTGMQIVCRFPKREWCESCSEPTFK